MVRRAVPEGDTRIEHHGAYLHDEVACLWDDLGAFALV